MKTNFGCVRIKSKLFFITFFSLSLPINSIPAIAAPKEGTNCTTVGKLSGKLTCISLDEKKFWYELTLARGVKKYAQVNTSCYRENMITKGYNLDRKLVQLICKYPSHVQGSEPPKWIIDNAQGSSSSVIKRDYKAVLSTDGGYLDDFPRGPCQVDSYPPEEWTAIQNFTISLQRCGGQIRLAKYNLGNLRPNIAYQKSNEFSNVYSCKVSGGNHYSLMHRSDSWAAIRKHPGPNSIIQLIPIYSEDSAPPKNSPKKDYEKYLSFIKEWADYSTDFESNVQYRIPDEYIKFPNKIADYNLYHPVNFDTPGHVRFNKDVIAAVDSIIDFNKVDLAVVVAPPGTNAAIMQQAALGSFNTAEGLVPIGMSQFADVPSNPTGSIYSGLTSPFWWIHEAYHAGYGLDDHYGDAKFDVNTEYGLGWWTMMTPWGGDLSIWEKWLLGFVRDSQIQCKTNLADSTHWIAPSSVRTQESKALVIPISSTKVIVAESIRAAGLHYKVPKEAQGVIIYEIDLTKSSHGMGMKLSLPSFRLLNNDSKPFFLAGASLKVGESTISNGYTLTVIESGNFGDVIKVEKK